VSGREPAADGEPDPAQVRRGKRIVLGIVGALLGLSVLLLAVGLALYHGAVSERQAVVAAELDVLAAEGLGVGLESVTADAPERPLQAALDAIPAEAADADPELDLYQRGILVDLVDPDGRPSELDLEPADVERARAFAASLTPHVEAALASDGLAPGGGPLPLEPGPGLIEARTLVKGLRWEVILAIAAGDAPAGWAAAERLAGLTRRLAWPTLDGRLLQLARARDLCHAVVALVKLGPPAAERAERLGAALEVLADPTHLVDGLRGDLALDLLASRALAGEVDGPAAAAALDRRIGLGPGEPRPDLAEADVLADRIDLVRRVGALLRAARESEARLRQAIAPPPMGAIPRRHVLTILQLPTYRKIIERELRGRAELRLARMALALAETVPFPESPPLQLPDPFGRGGALLRWDRDGGNQGLLWSVGPDPERPDDGGPSAPPGAIRYVLVAPR